MRDNVKGGALTEVTFYILLSLYTPKHGYAVMQFIEEKTGGPSIKYFSMATALFMQKISGQSTGRNPVRRLAANSTVLPVFVFIMLMSRNISHSAQINQRK